VRFSDLIDQKAAGLKRWKTRKQRVKYLPHIRDIERYGMPRDYGKEAMEAYPQVVAKLTRQARISPDEVREIVADAAMETVLQERKGKPVDNVVAFMTIAAKRRIIDAARTPWSRDRIYIKGGDEHDAELERISRRGWLGKPDGYTEDPMEILMEAEEEEIDRIALKNRFNQLNDAPRRCYLLRAEGFSNPQVAARLGISVNTVEQNLQKAFDHLRITPTGQLRRPLFIPMDVTRHHYGLNNRKAPKDVMERVKKRA
jgi:RNA polymerase sigma factor (sigma-70 family)